MNNETATMHSPAFDVTGLPEPPFVVEHGVKRSAPNGPLPMSTEPFVVDHGAKRTAPHAALQFVDHAVIIRLIEGIKLL
jgi:hypothetical protein